MGCPHLTFETVREIARLIKGKKVKEGVHFWLQTDTASYYLAHHYGDAKAIEDAGGKIFHQTCMGMNPMRYYPKGLAIATNSFKYVKLGGGFGCKWIFGACTGFKPICCPEGKRALAADRRTGALMIVIAANLRRENINGKC